MPFPAFCVRCGASMQRACEESSICTGCGVRAFPVSHPTAGVLIRDGRRILLVRRGAPPAQGKWDVPGGFLREGELPEEGARREIREELGLEIGPLTLAQTDINALPDRAVLDILYEAVHDGKEIRVGSDVAAFGWFDADDLPEDLAFDATRRILERWRAGRPDAGGRLSLLGGETVDLDAAVEMAHIPEEVSFLPAGWRPECGEWRAHQSVLCGAVQGESAAALWCDTPVPGDHALRFVASTVPPRVNDINCFWEGSGAILGDDPACTIAGVGGWWAGLTGIERHPEGSVRAAGRSVEVLPGARHEIVAGRAGPHDFLFVDGKLRLQLSDPAAPRRREARVALATWNSHVHFHGVRLYRLAG